MNEPVKPDGKDRINIKKLFSLESVRQDGNTSYEDEAL